MTRTLEVDGNPDSQLIEQVSDAMGDNSHVIVSETSSTSRPGLVTVENGVVHAHRMDDFRVVAVSGDDETLIHVE